MKHPEMRINRKINVIYIHGGEWITVWLEKGDTGERVQVELRVLDSRTPEIFLRPEHMKHVKSFDDYYTPTGKKGD